MTNYTIYVQYENTVNKVPCAHPIIFKITAVLGYKSTVSKKDYLLQLLVKMLNRNNYGKENID